jgi:hypothetical protein
VSQDSTQTTSAALTGAGEVLDGEVLFDRRAVLGGGVLLEAGVVLGGGVEGVASKRKATMRFNTSTPRGFVGTLSSWPRLPPWGNGSTN